MGSLHSQKALKKTFVILIQGKPDEVKPSQTNVSTLLLASISLHGYLQRSYLSIDGYLQRSYLSIDGYLQISYLSIDEYLQTVYLSIDGYLQRSYLSIDGYLQTTYLRHQMIMFLLGIRNNQASYAVAIVFGY